MAKCKDCLHYEACSAFSKIINAACDVEQGCEHFKDLSNYQEVVRCNACKHCRTFYPVKEIGKEAIQVWYCDLYRCNRKTDEFCSDGERREGE